MTPRVGLGFDVHPFTEGRALVLGGVVIEDCPGLAGHSDADVVAHAVSDALLGAAGLPDLGALFPASVEEHRGARSVGFLTDICERLRVGGWRVVNVDVVIAAERPQLAPHLGAIVTSLAVALEPARRADDTAVPISVKPKRAEGLGAIGRAEGIAAWAVALLEHGDTSGASATGTTD
jgi:2-C-methyl-D-erythritol 2,4-cyclodiphosphate synthase